MRQPTLADEQFGPTDALSLFFRDVPNGPLLTGPQEQALTRRARGEDVLVPPPGPRRPTPAEAVDRMIQSNLRLVIKLARHYANRGLPIEDLIQEGVLGLRRATQKFDPDKGWRFSTYATWWIRQSVSRALTTSVRTIKLPGHVTSRIPHIQRTEQKLRIELGRHATSAEVGAELGLSGRQVEDTLAASSGPMSLDQPYGREGDMELADIVADSAPGPAETAEAASFVEAIAFALDLLNPREKAVLCLRHGIGSDQPQTLDEVGQVLGVSRERVRQIEGQALRRMRGNPTIRRRLSEWT
jgi:RNA polymerase primary sigma factor